MSPLFITNQNNASQEQSNKSTQNHDHHNPPIQPKNNPTTQLRKYIVLLQDTIAIKFIPEDHDLDHPEDQQPTTRTPSITPSLSKYYNSSSPPDEGLKLYKLFLSSNKKASWNPQTQTSISSLKFKGFITPSTILITSTQNHLNTLRTSYERRILRNPPGYRIEILAEIEEIVAEPVQQGHFTPLSDSLCWTILNLTDSNSTSFVNDILPSLNANFPGVSGPPKELVYQTLEKLIRERKVYQNCTGYHVVTPDVSEYISSVGGGSHCFDRDDWADRYCLDAPPRRSSTTSLHINNDQHHPTTRSRSTTCKRSNSTTNTNQQKSHSPLKRHNSLKIIRQTPESVCPQLPPTQPTMGARSLSFRLSKVNSLFDSDREEDEDSHYYDDIIGLDIEYWKTRNGGGSLGETIGKTSEIGTNTNGKRPSLLRRWLTNSFRKLKPKQNLKHEQKSQQTTTLSKSNDHISQTQKPTYNSLPSHNRQKSRPQIFNDKLFNTPQIRNPRSRPSTPSSSSSTIYSRIPTHNYPRVFQRYKNESNAFPTNNRNKARSSSNINMIRDSSRQFSSSSTRSIRSNTTMRTVLGEEKVDGNRTVRGDDNEGVIVRRMVGQDLLRDDDEGFGTRCSSDDVSH